jgi:hypothetical protein
MMIPFYDVNEDFPLDLCRVLGMHAASAGELSDARHTFCRREKIEISKNN